jgi:hypothetical protein
VIEQLVTAIVSMVLGVAITIFALMGADHFVIVRDAHGTRVVKYQGDYYKLVPVEIKGTVEVVE